MKIISKKQEDTPSNLSSYTPIRSIFDDFFRFPTFTDDFFLRPSLGVSNISADVWEEGDNVMVKMALPGVNKDDIKIDVERDSVRISGHTKKEEKEDSNKKYYFRSMESSFEQSFNLPAMIDTEKVEATFKDGVLEVKLPKAEQYKPKQIKVN